MANWTVLKSSRGQLHSRPVGQVPAQDGDGLRLVVLHGDHPPVGMESGIQRSQSPENLLRIAAQQGVVGGDVGLALTGVYQDSVHPPLVGGRVLGGRRRGASKEKCFSGWRH